jgi:hypothetical protein
MAKGHEAVMVQIGGLGSFPRTGWRPIRHPYYDKGHLA